jgi:predicted naringenin-chalcone synthase
MGCYASLPAVRIADGFRAAGLAHGLKRIDIVHTEICSLHLNLADHSPEQMVVQSLFADGHIRYSAVSSESAEPGGLELVTIHEEILPNTLDFMTWQTSEWGMRMTLSKEVPKQLAASIQGFISRMLTHAQLENPHFLSEAIFAIHPGGPRIIDQLQAELNLREEQVSHSKKILFDYGNMSSATLPHIWNSILGDTNIPAGKWIVSLAFGPGLTAFGALMRKRES